MNRDIRSKSYKIIITIVFVVLSAAYWVLFYLWEFRNLAIPYSIGEFMGLGEFVIPIIAYVLPSFMTTIGEIPIMLLMEFGVTSYSWVISLRHFPGIPKAITFSGPGHPFS